MPKAFLVDTTRCTACRGCQVACKEWKDHPPVATKQTGTHQNPPDLNPYNYKLVRFSEHLLDGVVKWYFFPDQCRHCVAPPCKNTADMSLEGAVIQDEATGAVIFTEKTKEISKADQESIRESCPYDIPRSNEKTGLLTKCDMCIDRVQANRLPMCVKSCAMGAMQFGEREEMLKVAQARLAEIKAEFPAAKLLDADDVAVIFLVEDDPKRYHTHAVAQLTAPAGPLSRQQFLARANPLRGLARTFHG
ncbi:4Fe-4S dicluster domain-containing protein [Megalodesulfovibrio gigas]|uniref:Putative Fe-S-cluster-containing hydrogenase component protein n=1 Tax=Megalodesulfovibrio gigas (strain ATCC 19364 / DSM 1382 / NCIMB 9332 / VKM B-1759) TaxID=1121448 RepID=T2GFF9_MEGG1|nr:4Fe-4S dicluster domain-containing protein [Megalodesulfovibrio gigas]AGW15028.1 putative Fe-S-cluster-containing hydrogenase component protein [Megalodesulfovibrio gigas DSM 1382 = ATCC 19364]